MPSGFAFFRMPFFQDVEVHNFNIYVRFFRSSRREGSIGGSFWGSHGGVQNGLGIVWVRTLFRLAARDRFLDPFGGLLSFGIAFLVVLGSSWGRFWSSWAPLRVVFGRSGGRFGAFSAFQLIDSTRQLINSSIQLINSSTHGPSALSYPARRTARCAIK